MNNNTNFITYDWGQIDLLNRKIAEKIKNDSFVPDHIVGISRCGLVPATHLAYLLNVKSILTIKAKTTPNDEILAKKEITPTIELLFDNKLISSSKILLVDTVIASGTTFLLCLDMLKYYKPKIIKTVAVIDWPNSPYKIIDNKIRPKIDYSGQTVDEWPDFPWEH